MLATLLDIVSILSLGLGLTLATIGLYGLLRMPDIFHQLHPNGLITGPAVILALFAAIGTGSAEIITSAALVILFVLITAPLSSHAIAQAAHDRAHVGEAQE
jgi:monovalent cation/proton antiporter MnhG/PhaG subunit